MKVKYLQLKFIVFLLFFFSIEITGIFEPVTNLHLPDVDIENEVELARPVSYKLAKIPVKESIELNECEESSFEFVTTDFESVYSPVSYTTHSFCKSGAKLARELSTIG